MNSQCFIFCIGIVVFTIVCTTGYGTGTGYGMVASIDERRSPLVYSWLRTRTVPVTVMQAPGGPFVPACGTMC